MKIAAITRYKNGCLFEAMRKLVWTQGDLAERAGLSLSVVANIINLRRKPTVDQGLAIQKAFGDVGTFLDVEQAWPEDFRPLEKGQKAEVVQVAEIDMNRLAYDYQQQLLPETNSRQDQMLDQIDDVFDFLLPSERELLTLYYREAMTLVDISAKHNVIVMTTRSRLAKAERHLRRLIIDKTRLEEIYEFSPGGYGWDVLRSTHSKDHAAPNSITEVAQLTKVIDV